MSKLWIIPRPSNSTSQSTLIVMLNIQLLDQSQALRSALKLWNARGWHFSRFGEGDTVIHHFRLHCLNVLTKRLGPYTQKVPTCMKAPMLAYLVTTIMKPSNKLNGNCCVFRQREFCNSITGPVTIYIDSQAAALKVIKSNGIKSTVIIDCRKALLEIREFIVLCWVPGHSYIVGNEIADKLPRAGFRPIDRPINETVKLPTYKLLCQSIENYSHQRTGSRWHLETGCKVSDPQSQEK